MSATKNNCHTVISSQRSNIFTYYTSVEQTFLQITFVHTTYLPSCYFLAAVESISIYTNNIFNILLFILYLLL